ncbi:g5112 [Coccomyxa viridis]|uniref:G5112 protein n=1 Tax=Coccomyxa viridis TaxID=1274662 RepID=A0ABP1FUV1_9CHLO
MSTKEEKPTLAGVQIKTRKRNIAVALDPGSFADAVVAIFEDQKDGDDLETNLLAGVKVLEATALDFSRYGDTLFEVLFAGGRLAAGGNVVEEGKKLDTNVLAAEPKREAMVPYIKVFQTLLRKRPFLIRPLENTLIKLLKSLDFYDELGRDKIAIATGRCFAMKLGVQPDRVLQSMLNDRMVAKGLILQYATTFFQDYLSSESIDDLVALLRKARLDTHLLDLFPPQKRTLKDLDEHFKEAGLERLVEYNRKKQEEVHLQELKAQLSESIIADPPLPVAESIRIVQDSKKEWQLPDTEIIKVIWTVLIEAIPTVGKNTQQVRAAIQKQVKAYEKLLNAFCGSARVEASLIVHVQVCCYEDSKLLKLFTDIVRMLYDCDILAEDTINWWAKKGSHPKGRNVFLRDMEPFLKWLDEAEEDEGEEQPDLAGKAGSTG